MNPPQVLCVGEILFDQVKIDPVKTLPSLSKAPQSQRYPGGAPANVACALAKLGTASAFIGCIGNDAEGQALCTVLQQCGVNVDGVQVHPSAPTRVVDVVLDAQGQPTFAGFGGIEPGRFADAWLQTERIPRSLFKGAQFLVLGTLGLAYPTTGATIHKLLRWAKADGLNVVLDVNWRPMFWPDSAIAPSMIHPLLGQIDILKLSVDEADWLFGTSNPQTIHQNLATARGVVVTAGAQGCDYAFAGMVGHVPAMPTNCIDTTGAGDAFVAGLLHQVCRYGKDQLQCVEGLWQVINYATAVAALSTEQHGAITSFPNAQVVKGYLDANQFRFEFSDPEDLRT